ncbi:hypothetical protein AAHE18_08G071200 [Arachis hypogaea]|nr:uncharacterized protein DS421_8g231660 [Arachis hypogaea]
MISCDVRVSVNGWIYKGEVCEVGVGKKEEEEEEQGHKGHCMRKKRKKRVVVDPLKRGRMIGWGKKGGLAFGVLSKAGERPFSTFSFFLLFLLILTVLSLSLSLSLLDPL